jgi:hypothetical protein
VTVSIIELNDHEVRVATDDSIVVRSPAAATVTHSTIDVGLAAYHQAHLQPRETYQKFWYELNQTTLRNSSRSARHHADLAYLHLQQILNEAGKPEEVIIAIPGGFSHDQIALLLGIAQACDVNVIGIADAAVAEAASCVAPGKYQHIEMQQYRTVVTNLSVDDVVTRDRLDVLEGIGTANVAKLVAEFIADQFLLQSRFDPLHQANTEQLLFNEIPNWLQLLRDRSEVDLHIDFRRTRFNARIKQSAVIDLLEPMYVEIRERLLDVDCCLIGSRLAKLPGLRTLEREVFFVPESAVFTGCKNIQSPTMEDTSGHHLLTRLPATETPSIGLSNITSMDRESNEPIRRATHILCRSMAFLISPASRYFSQSGKSSTVADEDSMIQIWRDSTTARFRRCNAARIQKNGIPADVETEMALGDRITIDESTLVFEPIHVVSADAE